MRLHRALAATLLVAVTAAGCTTTSEDDETTPRPSRTTTSTVPAIPSQTAVPGRLPVGAAGLLPAVPVWAQGTVLHVGAQQVDVSPRRIDAFVVTRGGVYFLDGDELWFTDLRVVRAAGITSVTRLEADGDGSRIRVTTERAGTRTVRGYETESGRSVPARSVEPLTSLARLGRPSRLALRTERSDVSPTQGTVPVRMGAGKYGLVDVEGGPLVAFDTTYDLRVALTGVVGREFELVRWTAPDTFYGLALESGRPIAVLSCELVRQECRSWGSVDADQSLLFESGS